MPAVSDYDLLIIDEAHRGYILDKEMCEDEVLYRDQREYQSKYRAVIEYFNAIKIALTATPALQTTEIFGQPVFKYTYREAVIEGYLVDHDAPHELKTKLSSEGIHYKQGETVTIYDPVTGEITNSELIDDELDFDVDSFNRQVITEPFNRAVLEEIAKNIDPESPREQGKTLIYAVNDDHADLIVSILKDIYTQYGVDNDAIMKITGSVANGNKKKIQEAIKRFKNEDYPSIVVTVDLLTTGIDVPSISTNEEMAADIISLIRRYAIGSVLISHEARIRKAVDRLRKAHTFTMQEQNWIKRMEDYLLNEAVLNVQVFDEDSRFKSQGGFAKINKVFGNKLESVVIELNEYLYDDGGRTA